MVLDGRPHRRQGQECRLCGRRSPLISAAVGLCVCCVRQRPDEAVSRARDAHAAARRRFGLPAEPPNAAQGVRCPLCFQECRIGEGERGYCGLRTVRDGRLVHLGGTARRGVVQWYRDPLPTNCVAAWVCDGSCRAGRHNLAVFYSSCTLDCLFCQNWHFRAVSPRRSHGLTAGELADAANPRTYCVCFFGGDPASQMPHALDAGRRLARRGVTVCWETAGTSRPQLLDHALTLALDTGGCIKFDLKAFEEPLHVVLTGSSNRRTLANFARAVSRSRERPDPPPVVASTLLVPGYVDASEVGRIARFIAANDPSIPYTLLAFVPHFMMSDLPRTSWRQARAAAAAAREAGLERVRVGNRHLLS